MFANINNIGLEIKSSVRVLFHIEAHSNGILWSPHSTTANLILGLHYSKSVNNNVKKNGINDQALFTN